MTGEPMNSALHGKGSSLGFSALIILGLKGKTMTKAELIARLATARPTK